MYLGALVRGTLRSRKRMLDLLELELQEVKRPLCVLGTETVQEQQELFTTEPFLYPKPLAVIRPEGQTPTQRLLCSQP